MILRNSAKKKLKIRKNSRNSHDACHRRALTVKVVKNWWDGRVVEGATPEKSYIRKGI